MHQVLRAATHDAHQALDGQFGSLDLSIRSGFSRLLTAHAIGIAALFPAVRSFTNDILVTAAPDLPAMLRADLAALDIDADALPGIALATQPHPAGVTYVVSGSRLGLAMLRRQGYWGKEEGSASVYMEDTSGLDVWRSFVRWMSAQTCDGPEMDEVANASRQAFEVFGKAFALSDTVAA